MLSLLHIYAQTTHKHTHPNHTHICTNDTQTYTPKPHTYMHKPHTCFLSYTYMHTCVLHTHASFMHTDVYLYAFSSTHTHVHMYTHTHTHINPICKGQVLSILPLYPPYLSNPATMALELRPSSLLTWLLGDLPECSPSFLWTQAPHQSQRYISKWKSSIVLPSCTLPHLLLSVA